MRQPALDAGPPITRRVRRPDYVGPGGMYLEVPIGWTAVQVGTGRQLQPGRHRVRGRWSAFPIDWIFIATGSWTLMVRMTGLLAGGPEGQLLDADLGLQVRLADAAQFGAWALKDTGDWHLHQLTHCIALRVRRALSPWTRRYLPDDLIAGGRAAEKVLVECRPGLAALLSEVGLKLVWAQIPIMARSTDVVVQGRRWAELKVGLRQIENDDTIAPLPNRVESMYSGGECATRGEDGFAMASHPAVHPAHISARGPGPYARWAEIHPRPASRERRHIAARFERELAHELARLANHLRGARRDAYRSGQAGQVSLLKELEHQIRGLADANGCARPAYMSVTSGTVLAEALAHEDHVLRMARALVERAAIARTKAVGNDIWKRIGAAAADLKVLLDQRARLSWVTD